jgi:hypothetical protein
VYEVTGELPLEAGGENATVARASPSVTPVIVGASGAVPTTVDEDRTDSVPSV